MEPQIAPYRSGMQCTVGYDDATGEALEPIVGNGHDPYSPFADEVPQDYFDRSEPTEEEDANSMIVEGLHELYPDLEQILDHAIANNSDAITEAYDEAIENDDWSTVNKYLETWSEEYRSTIEPQLSYEEINEGLNELAETQAEGMETAYDLLQQAEYAEDPITSEMLQVAASFHKGDVSAEDAIQGMLDRYPIEQLLPIFNKLNK